MTLDDGRTVTRPLVQQLIAEESSANLPAARSLFEAVATSDELTDFLTLPAYEILVNELGERLGVPMPATRTATMTDTKARG